ncbi:cupin domain-containing protein [Leifsonia sp. Leaf264]|uniref:cupin domain-containing protein n=1 Tax=Leifsonia sp. Leaf264 TaxID=1736314 RepID=UPI0006F2AAB8|nr:cupin domain-containing protein [Leifsonia sp. Leaf264]KQO95913.1 cupin [Leifsonia sp. Leaf264]
MNDTERGPGDRPALSRCIRIPVDEFARDYWGRKPLLSEAATLSGTFDDLFSTDAVDELVTERGLRTPFIRMAHEGSVLKPASYTAPGGFGAEIGDQVSSDKVLAEFAGGATIVLQGLHRLWPPLIDFTRRLIDDIGHPAQVNAYVTPASSRGFDPHYDVHDVFVLQISGEKHWRIHAPVHIDPLRDQPWSDHSEAVGEAASHEPVIDAVLRPGDVLYLPRGWIHSAEALGDTSVHLTIGMAAYTRADIVQTLVSVAGDSPALRSSLPLGIDLDDPASMRTIVEQTLQDLLGVLGASMADADTTGRVARRLASRLTDATRPEPIAPLATVAAAARLDGASRVRWRGSLGARLHEADGRVRVVSRLATLSLPGEAGAALHHLITGRESVVSELPGLDEADAVVVVRRLLREGFLVWLQ